MQQSYDAMKLAMRVLAALTEKQTPDPNDVASLRALAHPELRNVSLDELACEVIQKALDRRAHKRAILDGADREWLKRA